MANLIRLIDDPACSHPRPGEPAETEARPRMDRDQRARRLRLGDHQRRAHTPLSRPAGRRPAGADGPDDPAQPAPRAAASTPTVARWGWVRRRSPAVPSGRPNVGLTSSGSRPGLPVWRIDAGASCWRSGWSCPTSRTRSTSPTGDRGGTRRGRLQLRPLRPLPIARRPGRTRRIPALSVLRLGRSLRDRGARRRFRRCGWCSTARIRPSRSTRRRHRAIRTGIEAPPGLSGSGRHVEPRLLPRRADRDEPVAWSPRRSRGRRCCRHALRRGDAGRARPPTLAIAAAIATRPARRGRRSRPSWSWPPTSS